MLYVYKPILVEIKCFHVGKSILRDEKKIEIIGHNKIKTKVKENSSHLLFKK